MGTRTGREVAAWLARHAPVAVLTGAGCSTASGIPDYRDREGRWKRPEPMRLQVFLSGPETRRRYWARSAAGWPRIAAARPNAAHRALAELERAGLVSTVVTQNVDGLHRRAGSRRLVELHGRLDRVRCLACGALESRARLQRRLLALNPAFAAAPAARVLPDGDAALAEELAAGFRVPGCRRCGGLLKPDVVFFGEAVPGAAAAAAQAAVEEAAGLLVVGSSLMVYSGFRLVRAAAARGLPVAILNLGRTRGDALAGARWEADCVATLTAAAARLGAAVPA
ncbi:NAD-dependent protein deacetylase [Inmirania thermothiophila]|uniref:NAD-dependent protein deacetylase n=1 Tax=Inmirania thermothiophila TaxID=1750597 RepID=A0A3N1Y6J0_9GAMM|nr:NAD-dependent protein deacetylase [Inmirania thermothiophila]ROR34424.1 NAD-dependent SIR2 family protein deacetylase [Inmirania thermothiophila]